MAMEPLRLEVGSKDTETWNVFRKRTNKRHMSKHRTNDFCHPFSAHFSVRAADGSRMEQ